MTDTNHIEQCAREFLAAEMREHYPSTADRLIDPAWSKESLPLSTEAAIRAIVAALSARASAGEGEEIAWEATTVGFTHYVTDARYQKFSPEIRRWYKPYRCTNCAAAPQPAQAGASGGGEDWRETERLRLLKLRQLLEGFEVEIEAEGLESPATYLDRVTLVGRFQPSAGGPEVAKQIAAILAAPVRDATPASPATGDELSGSSPMFDITPQPAAAHWSAWLESQSDDDLEVIFAFRPDLAKRLRDLLAAAPQPQADECPACKLGQATCGYHARNPATPPAHGDGEGDDPFGDMPAPIGNPEAWPPNYADGYNDAVRNMVDSFPSVRARLTTRPTPEAQEARDAALTISVCEISDGDDPFIFAINGKTTIAVLQEIESDLLENRSEILRHGPGDYVFTVTQFEGQYGYEGRCEIAPGWELSLQSFAALALPAQGEGKA